jgi:hypothetical protein
LAALLPWWVSGDLSDSVAAEGAYVLLPAFATLLVPSAAVGAAAAQRLATGRALLRLSAGAFLTSTLVGAVLLWASYPQLDGGRRFILAISGGPAVMGFWVWTGILLGGWVVFMRRQSRRPSGSAQD